MIKNFLNIYSPPLNIPLKFADFDDKYQLHRIRNLDKSGFVLTPVLFSVKSKVKRAEKIS